MITCVLGEEILESPLVCVVEGTSKLREEEGLRGSTSSSVGGDRTPRVGGGNWNASVGVLNPTACLQLGDVLLFSVSREHHPQYDM